MTSFNAKVIYFYLSLPLLYNIQTFPLGFLNRPHKLTSLIIFLVLLTFDYPLKLTELALTFTLCAKEH